MSRTSLLEEVREAVRRQDAVDTVRAVTRAVRAGIEADDILKLGLGRGMEDIGRMFSDGEVLLPQITAATRAMDAGMGVLKDTSGSGRDMHRGTVVMGTVKGDIHEIGKDLCCVMLRGAGYKVVDLGCDVMPDDFATTAAETGACVIGASSLMTTTLVAQKDLVRCLAEYGVDCGTVMGGAPCTEEWCREIGADAYSPTAAEMVRIVGEMS